MNENFQLDADYTQVEYQQPEVPSIINQTFVGGTGSPVLTINSTVTGPSVTFGGGSSGFSYVAVGTTTLNLISALTTKGDIYAYSTVGTRLAVGANGTVLTADSTQTTGLRWATAAAGTVTSFSATPSGIFDVANATTTPALSLDNQTANIVLAGPSSGGAATPAFRALVNADLPSQAWTSWVPTWTNLTLGNGTATALYTQIGKLVVARLRLTFGTTTTVSGAIVFSFPVTSASYAGSFAPPIGGLRMIDASASAAYTGTVAMGSTTTGVLFAQDSAAGTYLVETATSSTIPFTWTTSDEIQLWIMYEAA